MAKMTISAEGIGRPPSLRSLRVEVVQDLLRKYVPLKEAAGTLGMKKRVPPPLVRGARCAVHPARQAVVGASLATDRRPAGFGTA